MKLNTVWMWGLVIATSLASSYIFTTYIPKPLPDFGNPDFDSGWITTTSTFPDNPATDNFIKHNLGTQDIFVYLIGKEDAPHLVSSQKGYGSEAHTSSFWGIQWSAMADWQAQNVGIPLDPIPKLNYIVVNTNYPEIRVLIWKLP